MAFDMNQARGTAGGEFVAETERVGLKFGHGVVPD
jgi:hypothetical protein